MTWRRGILLLLALPGLLALWAAPPSAADPLTTAPVLTAFDVSPRAVDVTDAVQKFTMTVRAPATTASSLVVQLYAPRRYGEPKQIESAGGFLVRSAGSDGVFTGTFTVRQGASPGLWTTHLAGSKTPALVLPADGPGGLTVLNSKLSDDYEAPQASDFQVTPSTVDVLCGPQKVTVSARLTDRSGVKIAALYLERAVSGASAVKAAASADLVSGTATDGVYRATLSLHPSQVGTWDLIAGAEDTAGNTSRIGETFGRVRAPAALTVTEDGSACGRVDPEVVFSRNHADALTQVNRPSLPSMKPEQAPGIKFRGIPGQTLTILTRTAPATAYKVVGTVTPLLGFDPALKRDVGLMGGSFPLPFTRTTTLIVRNPQGISSKPITLQIESYMSFQTRMTDPKTRSTRFFGTVLPAVTGRVVTVYDNGKVYGTTKTDGKGAWSLARNVAPGKHSFQAKTRTDDHHLGTASEVYPARYF